jgi:hypothetical protein
MAEYKTFFLNLKLFLNILLPLIFLYPLIIEKYSSANNTKVWWSAVAYGSIILFILIVLIFIKFKKNEYFRKYLAREYIPSLQLAIYVIVIDFILVLLFYTVIIIITINVGGEEGIFSGFFLGVFSSLKSCSFLKLLFMSCHLSSSILILILYLTQKSRNTAIISYMRHQYKIAILARDIGKNGLKKGQPIEIIKETSNGYIVKDSSNNDYVIERADIESFLDFVN